MHDAPWGHVHEEAVSAIEDTVSWTTVGIDVGSTTTQIVFSRVVHERREHAYVLAERTLLHQSDILLTPYLAGDTIDGAALKDFFAREYQAARLAPDTVDTGAVILTGLALETGNARAIAQAVADEAGKFVAISAGDALEARLAASGAGLAEISRAHGGLLVHIDVGGGTTKLTRWREGKLVDVAALDIGARLIVVDARSSVLRCTAPIAHVCADLGLDPAPGGSLSPESVKRLVDALAREILCHAETLGQPPRWPWLRRTAPLAPNVPCPAAVVFSGGVSEYIYGRNSRNFGDLGHSLGAALRAAVSETGIALLPNESGIRATVRGVSQHSVQLSGVTVFISDRGILPMRNIAVIRPDIALSAQALDACAIAGAIQAALAELALDAGNTAAVALTWEGSADYLRLSACAQGVIAGLSGRGGVGTPIVVVVEGDVAGILGANLAALTSLPVVVLDSVEVTAFDHLDIGAVVGSAAGVPVVVKSLLFAPTR